MSPVQLTDQQRFDWLRLIRTEGVGPRSFRTLVNRFGGASAALAALPDLARGAGRPVALPPVAEIERELEQARRLGVRFIAMGEAAYPAPLAASQTAPPILAVRGRLDALTRPMVALVGSRNASGLGLKFTETLARELGEAGFVIVSGLARGVDTAAHRASLRTGTVAVLAGGHGQVYPPQNEPLLEELLEEGAAVSELPFTVEARARDFPRRNRIVAALAMGVVVVEAARKSGSLITARLALEEGRELFAVPGSPLDPRAEGTNDLLARREAHLCRSARDVIAELEPQLGRGPAQGQASLFEAAHSGDVEDLGLDELEWLIGATRRTSEPAQAHEDAVADSWVADLPDGPEAADDALILDLLGAAPIAADDLARQSGLAARHVQGLLVELEMRELVRRDASGGYVRASSPRGA
jgi:DNA processing protein